MDFSNPNSSPNSKNKKPLALGIIVAVLLLFAVFLLFSFKKNYMGQNFQKMGNSDNSYVIPGVPYYGVYNYKGYSNDTASSAASILEYWNPGKADASEINKNISKVNGMRNIATFFSSKDFSAQIIKLSLTDFAKYINSQTRTPLLLSLPISPNQSDMEKYYPIVVLIGVDGKNQKLTFHNYWLGNNYEMSFAEFNKLEDKLPSYKRNIYLVVQPKNLSDKVKEIKQRKIQGYPTRTTIMQNGKGMFNNYSMGYDSYIMKMYDTSLDYFSRVEKSSNFNDYFPPYFKTLTYYRMGQIYYNKGDMNNALTYAQKAEQADQNLDQPFKDWPGIKIDWYGNGIQSQLSSPYRLLGDIYRQKNNSLNALDNYTKALKINPNNQGSLDGIQILNAMGVK